MLSSAWNEEEDLINEFIRENNEIIPGVLKNKSAVHSCWANFRVKLSETPRKFVLRSRS